MASLRMLLCPLFLVGVLAGLQTQVVSASNDPNQEPLLEQNRQPNDEIKKIDERSAEYEENSEDDSGVDLKLERSVAKAEEHESLDEDDQELAEARRALAQLQKQILQRAIFNATLNGTTVVLLGNEYCLISHDTFGATQYPNDLETAWYFEKGPGVIEIMVHCEFFKVEWANCCQIDRFVILRKPYIRGVRYCGQLHGLWKTYDTDIKIRWTTSPTVTRAGFTCKVTGMGCCGTIPVEPAVRKSVLSCADLLPGYDYCNCTDIGPGKICLKCSICETCQMEFFAAHNFSQVYIYTIFEFPCPNCTMDLRNLTYGFEQRVKGNVECINPYYTHITRPTYPVSDITIALFCPINTAAFDLCAYFASLFSRSGRQHYATLLGGELPHKTQKNSPNLVILTGYGTIPGNQSATVNLSALSNTEDVVHLTINDTTCDLFSGNQEINLSAFTQVQVIDIYLCGTSLPCNSVVINSTNITLVTIHLTRPAYCNPNPVCIVHNQAESQLHSPTISCQVMG